MNARLKVLKQFPHAVSRHYKVLGGYHLIWSESTAKRSKRSNRPRVLGLGKTVALAWENVLTGVQIHQVQVIRRYPRALCRHCPLTGHWIIWSERAGNAKTIQLGRGVSCERAWENALLNMLEAKQLTMRLRFGNHLDKLIKRGWLILQQCPTAYGDLDWAAKSPRGTWVFRQS